MVCIVSKVCRLRSDLTLKMRSKSSKTDEYFVKSQRYHNTNLVIINQINHNRHALVYLNSVYLAVSLINATKTPTISLSVPIMNS